MCYACLCVRIHTFFFLGSGGVFLSVCLTGERLFTVLCHRNREWFFASHLSSFCRRLLCCLRDQTTSPRWSAHAIFPNPFLIPANIAMLTRRSDPEYVCERKNTLTFISENTAEVQWLTCLVVFYISLLLCRTFAHCFSWPSAFM